MSENETSESSQGLETLKEMLNNTDTLRTFPETEVCSRCGKHQWDLKLMPSDCFAAECTSCGFRLFFEYADRDDE